MFVIIGIIAFIMIGMIAAIASFYKKPKMGEAIIRTGIGGAQVAFEKGILVVPVAHNMEIINLTTTTIRVDLSNENALISKDHKKVDVKLNFMLRINLEASSILTVANAVGCERSFDQKALNEMFGGKFAEAVKTTSKNLTFEEMQDHDNFKWQMLQNMDTDLNGYILDDCIINHLKENKPQNTNSFSV